MARYGVAAFVLAIASFSPILAASAFEAKPFDLAALNDRADPALAKDFAGNAEAQTIDIDMSDYAAFLATYVVEDPDGLNLVRYGAVSDADHQALKAMIASWSTTDWMALTAPQKFAFFTNLYNAVTLDIVLDHYPLKTIRDIRIETGEEKSLFAAISSAFDLGPWSAPVVDLGGTTLSLDQIEHSILRPMGDERVHFAVNCASIGCPDLMARPWSAETLDSDLDAATQAYVNSERGLRQTPAGSLLASKIFDWYADDFGGEAELVAYLTRYAKDARAEWLAAPGASIVGYRYDWDLNDAKDPTEATGTTAVAQ